MKTVIYERWVERHARDGYRSQTSLTIPVDIVLTFESQKCFIYSKYKIIQANTECFV